MKAFRTLKRGLLVFVLQAVFISYIFSQDTSQSEDLSSGTSLNLFLDCYGCDINYIRTEMPYINFVRDVRDAQVYLLITRQSTGSGGTRWTLFYNGQEKFQGMNDTLTYDSSKDDTFDITRKALTNSMALGLMRYVARTSARDKMLVSYNGEQRRQPDKVKDNWDFWVFEINTEPQLRLEKSEKEYSWRNNLRINRVTPEWKILNNFNHNYRQDVFYTEEEDVNTGDFIDVKTEAVRKSWSINNLTVRSLGEHWSAGIRTGISSSSYSNLDLKMVAAPAMEYNFFPYSESNQRQLTVLYGFNFIYNNYTDSTIYDRLEESLMEQSVNLSLQVQQKWGNANISMGASNYMNDFSKNKIELNGFLRVRIVRGLSIYVNSGVEFIHDQIELAKGNNSREDVYLRLRELETNFRLDSSLGISYTFGSIYNNIVNPRF